MAWEPINFDQYVPHLQIASLLQGLQVGDQRHAQRLSEQRQQQADEQARAAAIEKRADLMELDDNPTNENFGKFISKYPKEYEASRAKWEMYQEGWRSTNLAAMSDVYHSLNNDRPDVAKSRLQTRLKTLRNGTSPVSTEETETILKLLDGTPEDIKLAKALAFAGLAVAGGVEKFDKTVGVLGKDRREEELQPSSLRKAEAEADVATVQAGEAPVRERAMTRKTIADADTAETTAEFAPRQEEAKLQRNAADIANIQSAISDRTGRLALDRDKLESDVQLQLDRMDYDRTKLTDGAAKIVTDAVVSAEGSRSVASRARSLADRFERTNGTAGPLAWVGDKTGINGQEASQLRRDYAAIVGTQAIRNLPPGSASDADVALALKGFPLPTSRPTTITSFLRGMAKLQDMAANAEQSRADWVAGNGNLGTLQRDVYVNGVRVPKGTTYGEFSKTRAALERKDDDRAAVSQRSYMRHAR